MELKPFSVVYYQGIFPAVIDNENDRRITFATMEEAFKACDNCNNGKAWMYAWRENEEN